MADLLPNIGRRLQAFGAGVQGTGAEFVQSIKDERRRGMALDFRDIANFARAGNVDRALTLANNRLAEVGRLGGDPSSSQFVKTLLEAGQTEEALNFIDDIDQRFVSEGLLEPRQTSTVLPSSAVSATGQVLSQAPSGAVSLETLQDFKVDPSAGGRGQIRSDTRVQDEAGNNFISAMIFNPNSNTTEEVLTPVGGGPAEPVGRVVQVDAEGLTPTQRVEQSGLEAGTIAAATAAIAASKDAFEALGGVEQSISTLDEVLPLLQEGVDTGPILNRLPSFRQAALELDNIQARLGLNIIQNTTFGSLSEAELKFALDTALPTGLQPAALKDWIIRKQDVQRKLASHMKEAAMFLGTPGNTIPKWLEFQKQREILNASSPTSNQRETVVDF